jgi:hypothetical protein
MGIAIKSTVVAEECRTFVIKPSGKKEHQDGHHDDCVFAMALTAIGMRSLPKTTVDRGGPRKIGPVFYGRKKLKDEDDD